MSSFDTIVVGGGHNTLTAAGYLAKAGHSVLVLEKNSYVGGGVVSQEVTVPGFQHDLHATAIYLIRANPLFTHDELDLFSKQNFEMVDIDGPYFSSVFDDGEYLCTYFDVDKTCAEIARFSEKDAEAYRRVTQRNLQLLGLVKRGLFSPPVSLGALLKLVERSELGRYLTQVIFSSSYELINRNFEHPHVRAHLYKWCAENLVSPDEPGTGIVFLMLLGLGHAIQPGVIKGGGQQLSEALRRAVEAHGGVVRTNAEVVKFDVSGGRISGVQLANGESFTARRSVIAATPPWDLRKMIDGLDESRLGDIASLKRSEFAVFLTHYALKEAPRFRVPEHVNHSFVTECMTTDLVALRRCYDDFKHGMMPKVFSGHSFCATHYDKSRAPDGMHTLYLYHFAPKLPDNGRIEDWAPIQEGFADWVLEGLRRFAVNMDDSNILGRRVESPYDQHLNSPSFFQGECFGLALTSRHFMGERPTPELAQYRVPGVDGLYLCGPCQHPGGGAFGGGRPVAMRIMMDQGMDLKSVFKAL